MAAKTQKVVETMGIFHCETGWCEWCEGSTEVCTLCITLTEYERIRKMSWTVDVCVHASECESEVNMGDGTFTPVTAAFAAEWKARNLDRGDVLRGAPFDEEEDEADDEGKPTGESKPSGEDEDLPSGVEGKSSP